MIILNFFFEELGFGLHADSIILVNLLHVLGSIESRSISSPNAFKQTLSLLCHNYSIIHSSRDVLGLGVFGVFVNKG